MPGGKRNMTQPWRSWENSRFWDMSKKGGYRSLPPMGAVGLCLGLEYFRICCNQLSYTARDLLIFQNCT